MWAVQWLRQPTPDEETARLRAQISKLRGQLKAQDAKLSASWRENADAHAETRQLATTKTSLQTQLDSANETIRYLEMELKVAARERELLEQIVERQQSREERDAKTNIMTAESMLKQVERLAGGDIQ